jgi:excisionase family DNA binding protein
MKQQEELLRRLSNIEKLLEERKTKPLNFNQAADYLGFSHSYLYKLTSRKKIPCHRPTGKMLFFSKAELDEWIFENRSQESGDRSQNKNNEEEDEPP